jgi:hypothetical protein
MCSVVAAAVLVSATTVLTNGAAAYAFETGV